MAHLVQPPATTPAAGTTFSGRRGTYTTSEVTRFAVVPADATEDLAMLCPAGWTVVAGSIAEYPLELAPATTPFARDAHWPAGWRPGVLYETRLVAGRLTWVEIDTLPGVSPLAGVA